MTKILSLYPNKELMEWVVENAKAEGRSLSNFCIRILEYFKDQDNLTLEKK